MYVVDGLLFILNGKAVFKFGYVDGFIIVIGCIIKIWMFMCYICIEYS